MIRRYSVGLGICGNIRLRDIVLGASFAVGLTACASLRPKMPVNPNFKTYEGFIGGYHAQYSIGSVNGKDVCGAKWEDDKGWHSIGDKGCDGIVDAYQGSADDGNNVTLKGDEYRKLFDDEFNPKLKEIREKIYDAQTGSEK